MNRGSREERRQGERRVKLGRGNRAEDTREEKRVGMREEKERGGNWKEEPRGKGWEV